LEEIIGAHQLIETRPDVKINRDYFSIITYPEIITGDQGI